MTSEHCSVKFFKKNLKSKLWILALAMIVNCLAGPVFYLIFNQNIRIDEDMIYFFGRRVKTYWNYQYILSTVIILATAFTVAVTSFRFLLHRNMVDLYHSMPVKRSTVFIANYVNGFITGYLPFVLNQLIVYGMISGTKRRELLRGLNLSGFDEGQRLSWLLLSLTISFLAVYNLFILAIMLCGNIISAMICAGTMGTVVAVATDAVGRLFKTYERTFTKLPYSGREMLWASPLLNANLVEVYNNAFSRVGYSEQNLPMMIVVAILLGVLAFVTYMKRPSEIAGHGLENKVIAGILRCATAVSVGIFGWTILLSALLESDVYYGSYMNAIRSQNCGWLIFGAILLTVLCSGVLDSLFKADIREFFSHKVSMVVCAAVVVAAGLGMHLDILKYSEKIPAKDQIVGIELIAEEFTVNRGMNKEAVKVNATPEQIYELLEKAKEHEKYQKETDSREYRVETQLKCDVELKGNKHFRRNLYLPYDDLEVLKQFVLDDNYVDANYQINQDKAQKFQMMEIDSMNDSSPDYITDVKFIQELIEAYNQDLKENKEAIVWLKGISIANVFLDCFEYDYTGYDDVIASTGMNSVYFTITDQMKHCMDVIKKNGMEKAVSIPKPEDVEAIRFDLGYTVIENCTEVTLRQAAMEAFRGYPYYDYEAVLYTDDWIMYSSSDYLYPVANEEGMERIVVREKDPKKIADIMAEANYAYNMFPVVNAYSVEAYLEMKDGSQITCILDGNKIPDEYIEKFAELGREYEEKQTGNIVEE